MDLESTLETMPDPEIIKAQAEYIRLKITMACLTTDWQKQSYDDLRHFLHFLFSDNPRQNNYGILLGKQDDSWIINFEGCFDFNRSIITGNEINSSIHSAIKQINAETKEIFDKGVKEADKAYLAACKEAGIEAEPHELFNDNDYL